MRRAVPVLVAAALALGNGAGVGDAAAGPTPAAAGQAGSETTAEPAPVAFEVRHDLRYRSANGQDLFLDAYVPDDTNAERVSVVLLHGGGWRTGDKADVVEEATGLARRGWVVFAVNYRLGERETFPAQVDDVRAAVDWARDNALDFRLDPGRMGAFGISAGGHLAAMLATVGEGPRDRDGRVLAAVSWSGPMDLAALAGQDPELAPLARLLLPCTPAECPARWDDASPITHVDPTDGAMLLANGDSELVPLSQAEDMAARLDTAGVEHRLLVVPGSDHGHDLRDEVWADTVAFLDGHLTRPTHLRPENPAGGAVLAGVVVLVVVGGTVAGMRVRRRLRAGTGSPRSRFPRRRPVTAGKPCAHDRGRQSGG